MPRLKDEPIPATELLYRSISPDDVLNQELLPDAVDLPRCSFNRGKYSAPSDVFTARRPGDSGIIQLAVGDLPPAVPRDSASPYVFFVADDPAPAEDPTNEAHCEVRIRPEDRDFNNNHKPNKTILAKARDRLARKCTIFRMPK